MTKTISAHDPYDRHFVGVLDAQMAYVDEGEGDPIVFLHGNPTSSYLWRNVIPHLAGQGRCLAPDLIGMGESSKVEGCLYTYEDQSRYLNAWFEALGLDSNIILVVHDWGGGLGLDWARRNPGAVQGIAYMETLVTPLTWDDWPPPVKPVFEGFRSPAGEDMVLKQNVFIEQVLPGAVLRDLTDEEMAHYRKPFVTEGESRRPTLTWPRMIPIEGEPADVNHRIDAAGKWMAESDVPKLLVNANPGAIMRGRVIDYCRTFPNQTEVTVNGSHFIQEDSPAEIGAAVSSFVANIRS